MSGRDVESGCFGGFFRKKRRAGLQSDTAPYRSADLAPDANVHYDEKVKAAFSRIQAPMLNIVIVNIVLLLQLGMRLLVLPIVGP